MATTRSRRDLFWIKLLSTVDVCWRGNVRVEGAKNAVLPILAAALLASEGSNVIRDVPNLSDVGTINEVLKSLNAKVEHFPEKDEVIIDSTGTLSGEAQFEYVRKMRASILVMGPLLARTVLQELHFQVAVPLDHVQSTSI